jgi:hypothetical protein
VKTELLLDERCSRFETVSELFVVQVVRDGFTYVGATVSLVGRSETVFGIS